MRAAFHRHDVSDHHWALIEPFLLGPPGCDLPPEYGDWKNTHRRFSRWRNKGVWDLLLTKLIVDPGYKWLMIDASHVKVHPHAAGPLVEMRK